MTLPAGSDRALALIDELVSRVPDGSISVRDIAADIGSTKSTVARVLGDLADAGVAERDSVGRYSVGPRLRVLSARIHMRHSIFRQGGPIAQRLADRAGATATINLMGPDRTHGFVAVRRSSSGPIGYNLSAGTLLPLHAGATGRALLSAQDDPLPDVLDLFRFTDETITDRQALEAQLAQDRSMEYVLSIGQHFDQAAGLSVPFVHNGLTGSITITSPRTRAAEQDLLQLVPAILDEKGRLEQDREPSASTDHLESTSADTTSDASQGGTAVARWGRFVDALVLHPDGLPSSGRALGRVVRTNPSTASKLAAAALHSGVAVTHRGVLHVGPTLLRWSAILGTSGIAELVRPIVHDLAHDTGETVGLIEFDYASTSAHQTLVVQGSRQMHYWMTTDGEIPLHAGASGKAILAYLGRDVLTALPLISYTANTDTDRESLDRALQRVREQGWATGDGERIAEAYGIAAPIFADGRISGSITVTIPRIRRDDVDTDAVTVAVVRAAEAISRTLSLR